MKKLALLLAALFCIGLGSPADAISISIGVGDEPYYVHGPGYWAGGVYYVWIPGHWCGWRNHHRVWCHGHYAVR
jgi:hypothetical protein